ncbi:MAG: PHP domain-containing protein [Bacteroidales bacterium]|nr:PHP domain-containing protein [Bacteroidales bacterium]
MIIDFHIHTRFSYDSMMSPRKILTIARQRGLDGIVVCDHNTVKGGLEVQKMNRDNDFMVIAGAEIATDAGDVTGIFLSEEIKSRNFTEVAREIRKQGGKLILNHPYRGHDLSKVDFSLVDFIEGFNGRTAEADNRKAVELARKYAIPIVAGSDAHLYAEIGNCKTHVADRETLQIEKTEYRRSSFWHITLSQYIKSIKRRSFKIFFSATAVHIKHCCKLIFAKK